MPYYSCTITIVVEADTEDQAWTEAERFAYRNDGGSVLSVEEVAPNDGPLPPPTE